jgi:hypothetical protein
MKLIVEIPDDQVLRGVPREGFAEYLAAAQGEAREVARAAVQRAIRFQTAFVPTVTFGGETATASTMPSFEDWIREVREEAWMSYLISEAEANALGMDQPETWRSYYAAGLSPARALAAYFDCKAQPTSEPQPSPEVQP